MGTDILRLSSRRNTRGVVRRKSSTLSSKGSLCVGWTFFINKNISMITVTKEFTFEACHNLADGYVGACTRPHGHSYILQVTVSRKELNELGMVMDFKELKAIWKDKLEPKFDHQNLNETLNFQTTAENMAKYIGEEFGNHLEVPSGVWVVKVKLWETRGSHATWVNPSLHDSFKK